MIYFVYKRLTLPNCMRLNGKQSGGDNIYFSHGCSNSKVVMIMYKKEVDIVVKDTIIHQAGRYIIQDILVDSLEFVLVNLYAPHSDDPLFFQDIFNMLQEKKNYMIKNLIMTGDYNTVLDVDLDRKGIQTKNYHSRAYNAISGLMTSLDLIDIWRLQNPKQTRYTWRRGNQASRIDYFLTSFSLTPKMNKVEIKERFRSDHHLITLSICTTTFHRGPGYWKLNQKLLKDKEFIDTTNKFIKDFFVVNNDTADPLIIWDAFKIHLKGTLHSIQLKEK